jgi:hypothetical protein
LICGNDHAVSQAESVHLFPVDREFLALGNLAGLIVSIFERQDDRIPASPTKARAALGWARNST